jgi:hypothetical protein
MITLDDLLTSSGKYKDRKESAECTEVVQTNGAALIEKVNSLLDALGVKGVLVSSGFRTSASNSATAGAAKKSHHMTGNAVDLLDSDGKLDALFIKHLDIVKAHGLYLEDPHSTPTWTHLQDIPTKNNPFKP